MTVLGITFKENVPDIRNSKVIDIVRELSASASRCRCTIRCAVRTKHARIRRHAHAPDALAGRRRHLRRSACDYLGEGWPLMKRCLRDGKGTVLDVKSRLDRRQKPEGIDLWRL